jgi:hypothetical protein
METRNSWADGRDLSGNHSQEYRHHDSFHPDPRDIALAREVLRPILAGETDGATIDAEYRAADCGESYVVGGRYQGRQYADINTLDTLAYRLHKYVVQTPTFGDRSPKLIGIWRDAGVVYFDYVTLHSDYLDALDTAKERGQVAVYDAAIGKSFSVETERYL